MILGSPYAWLGYCWILYVLFQYEFFFIELDMVAKNKW